MGKIDLHVHTISTSLDTKHKRDIDYENFCIKMENSNVSYVAITNHNIFNLEQYNEFSHNKKILIFPGVEVNLLLEDDKDYKNLNIILDPSYKEELQKITNKWNNDKYEIKGLDELLDTFDSLKPIYFCDKKGTQKRQVPDKVITELKKRTQNPVLIDCKNSATNVILGFYGQYALKATDNQDWNNYEEESKILANVYWDIKNFNELYLLLKFDNTIFKTLLQRKEIKEYNLIIDNDPVDIKIIKGVNVIFGGKGTGKTQILEQIHVQYSQSNGNSIHYESKNIDNSFKNEFPDKFDLNSNEIKDFLNLSDDITTLKSFYTEWEKNPIVPFSSFHSALENFKNSNYEVTKIQRTNISKPFNTEIFTDILKKYQELINELERYKNNSLLEFAKEEIETINKIFTQIKLKFLKEYISISKEYFYSKFLNKLIESFKNAINYQTGIISVPDKVGLFELWECRNKIFKILNKIMKFKNFELKHIHEGTKTNIPGKYEIQYIKSVKPFESDDDWNKPHKPVKSEMKKIIKQMEIITNIELVPKFQNIKNLLELIKINENDITEKSFILTQGAIHKIETINEKKSIGKKIKLSAGEQSMLMLLNKLDQPADLYLLDEPSNFLGSELVANSLLPKIEELKKRGATVVISTHDPSLAINSLPVNMVYRKHLKDDEYSTSYGHWWSYEFDKEERFKEIVINHFEGGLDNFGLRKEIYEQEIKNENK